MKLSREKLKQIIKEEIEEMMDEMRDPKGGDDEGPPDRESILHMRMVDLMDKQEELEAKMKKADGAEKEKLKKQIDAVIEKIKKIDREM